MVHRWFMANKIDLDKFMTFDEAAQLLGVSLATIYNWSATPRLTKVDILGKSVLERAQVKALAKERSSK